MMSRDPYFFSDHMGFLNEEEEAEVQESEMSDSIIKAQIASHPLYPILLSSYIHSRKVGAPPETASLLEEITRENNESTTTTELGADPQLDDFMESYCEVLRKYNDEISKQFDEATSYLSSIESQLTHLCNQTVPSSSSTSLTETRRSIDSEVELKEMLMRKYCGYLSSLREEFMKKKNKGQLPKDATSTLMEWWNANYAWPYPTEAEKKRLSAKTGLEEKQINNWFINQRKRHWRPSKEMRFALEGSSCRYHQDYA